MPLKKKRHKTKKQTLLRGFCLFSAEFLYFSWAVGASPSPTGGIEFAFCVFVRFGRADPSPTGVSVLNFAFCVCLGGRSRTPVPTRCGNFAFCFFVRFGRADPSPTGPIIHFAHSGVDSNSSICLVSGWQNEM